MKRILVATIALALAAGCAPSSAQNPSPGGSHGAPLHGATEASPHAPEAVLVSSTDATTPESGGEASTAPGADDLTAEAATETPALGFIDPMDTPARVDAIHIDKDSHTLELVVGDKIYKRYSVALGPGGMGPKQWEGDLRTPIGEYRVIGHLGIFHRFLHINYPNDRDKARYFELLRAGEVPPGAGVGHSIGIHGVNAPELAGAHKQSDWTLGCIALDDAEIDEIAELAPVGTKVIITR